MLADTDQQMLARIQSKSNTQFNDGRRRNWQWPLWKAITSTETQYTLEATKLSMKN